MGPSRKLSLGKKPFAAVGEKPFAAVGGVLSEGRASGSTERAVAPCCVITRC